MAESPSLSCILYSLQDQAESKRSVRRVILRGTGRPGQACRRTPQKPFSGSHTYPRLLNRHPVVTTDQIMMIIIEVMVDLCGRSGR